MNKALFALILVAVSAAACAKLPAPTDEAKAKAAVATGEPIPLEQVLHGVRQTLANPNYVTDKGVEGIRGYIVKRFDSNNHPIPEQFQEFVNNPTQDGLDALVAAASVAPDHPTPGWDDE
jgi:hypothetical protein